MTTASLDLRRAHACAPWRRKKNITMMMTTMTKSMKKKVMTMRMRRKPLAALKIHKPRQRP